MKNKLFGSGGKKEGRDALGLLCLAATFIFPLGLIYVFSRLLNTQGAPVWYLWLHGIITVGFLMQVIQFFRMGLIRAVHNWRAGRRGEGRNG